MNERRLTIIGTTIACLTLGVFGVIVGYGTNGFGVWPMGHRDAFADCIIYGTMIGAFGAAVTWIAGVGSSA